MVKPVGAVELAIFWRLYQALCHNLKLGQLSGGKAVEKRSQDITVIMRLAVIIEESCRGSNELRFSGNI